MLIKISILLMTFTITRCFLRITQFSKRDSSRLFCSPSPTPLPVKLPSADLCNLEIRIGKIVEIAKHPEADSLYVEKVDLGEPEGARTIVSGLVQYCAIDAMLNRNVIVLCNLKPRAIKGITSNGMLLCASNEDHTKVEPLAPPVNANIGELISFNGHLVAPVEPGNKASKSYSKIADNFYVNNEGVATFQDIPFMTVSGPVTSSLKGKIS